jgi:hypothetical protein
MAEVGNFLLISVASFFAQTLRSRNLSLTSFSHSGIICLEDFRAEDVDLKRVRIKIPYLGYPGPEHGVRFEGIVDVDDVVGAGEGDSRWEGGDNAFSGREAGIAFVEAAMLGFCCGLTIYAA